MNVSLEFSYFLLLYCAFSSEFMLERCSAGSLDITSLVLFCYFNLLQEHAFAIVISQLQRALQSELLFSVGSPSCSAAGWWGEDEPCAPVHQQQRFLRCVPESSCLCPMTPSQFSSLSHPQSVMSLPLAQTAYTFPFLL